METNAIKIKATVNAPVNEVWRFWTDPEHIKNWNHANDDWYTPAVQNDVRERGKFSWRMEAKDGSAGFDFEGTYTKVEKPELIKYVLDDGREVEISFEKSGNSTVIEETFEADKEHSLDMQKSGWQAILNNFKKYVAHNLNNH